MVAAFHIFGINYYQDGIKALLADYFMAKYVFANQYKFWNI
jgi:hypothetical protein